MDRIVPGLTARVGHDERSSLLKSTCVTKFARGAEISEARCCRETFNLLL